MTRPASRLLPPWEGPLPSLRGDLPASLVVPVPVGLGALVEPGLAAEHLVSLQGMMRDRFPGGSEVLLAPYGEDGQPAEGDLLGRLEGVTRGKARHHWIPGPHRGLGEAVRAAVLSSRGRLVLVANLEYYYDPAFFTQALDLLGKDRGLSGVRANRRLPDSEFIVPVTLLSMVYRRHLLGALLTRIWGAFFSLGISDALSGGYVLRRDFALRALNRVTCPWFLYGAELAILAKQNGKRIADIPVHFFMEAEKSRLRLWGEIFRVLHWTLRFFLGAHRGDYLFLREGAARLAADDWGLSPGINEGILDLARQGLLERVSVMSGGRYRAHGLKELRKLRGLGLGLHFNLTCPEAGGSFPSPLRFLAAWTTGRLLGGQGLVGWVRRALQEQLQGLRELGVRAQHLDGHHHVHAVPGLLGKLADLLKKEGIREVRVPYHPSLWWTGRAGVALLGRSLKPAVERLGFRSEPFFYPSRGDFTSLNRLIRALNRAPGARVLVHPARRDDLAQAAPSDPLRQERVEEYRLLRLLALERPRP